MRYCGVCKKDVEIDFDESNGFTCCTSCGRVLEDNVFSTDPTFSKTQGGASQVDGNFVPDSGPMHGLSRGPRGTRFFGYQVDSHEKTINKGKYEIAQVAERLAIRPREDITSAAHRLYRLAVQRNFTRGRRTQQVAGACLYIVCRQEGKPYMLIDFSDTLQTNVYVLGAVFLQLCRLLRLEQHPILQRPIDPSLYIHRFADRLEFGDQRAMHAVANTSLRLVASMKRDWMQTGRRPSGVCGAALFIAAHIHGHERTKSDVVSVVHVGEGTLRKRITEFEMTPSSALTVEQFDSWAKGIDQEQEGIAQNSAALELLGAGLCTELTCEHNGSGVPHFAHGMCKACYQDYAKVAGSYRGGADPPAYQRALRQQRALTAGAEDGGEGEGEGLLALPGIDVGVDDEDANEVQRAMDDALEADELSSALPPRLRLKRGGAPATAAAAAAAAAAGGGSGAAGRARKKGRKMNKREAAAEEALLLAQAEAEDAAPLYEDPAATAAAAAASEAATGAVSDESVAAVLARLLTEEGEAAVGWSGGKAVGQAKEDQVSAGEGLLVAADLPVLAHLVNASCFDPSARDAVVVAMEKVRSGWHAGCGHPAPSMAAAARGAAALLAAARMRQVRASSGAMQERLAAREKDMQSTAAAARDAYEAGLAPDGSQLDASMNHDGGGGEQGAGWAVPPRGGGGASTSSADPPPGALVVYGGGVPAGRAGAEGQDMSLDDIDDDDIEGYIHNAEEVELKEKIWSELNREYIQDQAAKEASLAAASEAAAAAAASEAAGAAAASGRAGGGGAEDGGDDGDGVTTEIVAVGGGGRGGGTGRPRGRPKGSETKKRRAPLVSDHPEADAENATRKMLLARKLSSKINYDALSDLFNDGPAPASASSSAAAAVAAAASAAGRKEVDRRQRQREADEVAAAEKQREALEADNRGGRVLGMGLGGVGGSSAGAGLRGRGAAGASKGGRGGRGGAGPSGGRRVSWGPNTSARQ